MTGTRRDRWRGLALAAALATYLLIVLGGWVRITGSGMGCGDHWPLCNGRLIPPMDVPTLIEWSHRLVAAGVSVLVGGLALYAWWASRAAGGAGAGGWSTARRLGVAAVVLLVVQVLLGAVTVWLELPPTSVILHLGTAMLLLAVLVVAVGHGSPRALLARPERDAAGRAAWIAAGLALVVVVLGALVANLGAATACRGFPLCSGAWVPAGGWRAHLQWTHRLLAYVLVIGVLLLPTLARRRRPADRAAAASAWLAVGVAWAQLGVAAAMVLGGLPPGMRALHVALGAAVFAALVFHAWVMAHPLARGARERPGTRGGGPAAAVRPLRAAPRGRGRPRRRC